MARKVRNKDVTKDVLVARTAEALRLDGARKTLRMPKHTFTITDEEGNSRKFYIRSKEATAMYTAEDINLILVELLSQIKACMRKGEKVVLHGFGTWRMVHYKPRKSRSIVTGKVEDIGDRYIPRFSIGQDLRRCAKVYEAFMSDRTPEQIELEEGLAALDDESDGDDDEYIDSINIDDAPYEDTITEDDD